MKRLAGRVSLQRPYEHQIMTPFQLYQWAEESIPGVNFCFCCSEEYERQKFFWKLVSNKQKQFLGLANSILLFPFLKTLCRLALSSVIRKDCVTKLPGDLELEDISGFVTCSYSNQWWLACVLETCSENVEAKLSLLYPPGPSRSYRYPDIPVIITLPLTYNLTIPLHVPEVVFTQSHKMRVKQQ